MQFIAHIKQISIKNTVDLSRTTRVILETEDAIASEFEKIAPDELVKIEIVKYGDSKAT